MKIIGPWFDKWKRFITCELNVESAEVAFSSQLNVDGGADFHSLWDGVAGTLSGLFCDGNCDYVDKSLS